MQKLQKDFIICHFLLKRNFDEESMEGDHRRCAVLPFVRGWEWGVGMGGGVVEGRYH